MLKNNLNYNPNKKINNNIPNSVVNNINVIWENNPDIKDMNLKDKSPLKNNYKNENYIQIQKLLNKYNKDIGRKDYIGLKTENKEIENPNNYINKNLNTLETIDKNKRDIIIKNNKIYNYRSKSRDNGNNIIRTLKDKFINKNILPPLDMRIKSNN